MKGTFNVDKAFGIELELLAPTRLSRRDIVEALNEADITTRIEGYNHETRPYWKLTSDASVNSRESGYKGDLELVSPKLYGFDGKIQLEKVLQVLNNLDCKVNVTCGTHVHHDVSDDVTKDVTSDENTAYDFLNRLTRTVMKYEHLIYKCISPSRLNSINGSYWTKPTRFVLNGHTSNVYKESLNKRVTEELKSDVRYRRVDVQSTRYSGLNLVNMWTRGSVEFRYHQGTLNFDKLWAWIVFTQAIVNSARESKRVNYGAVKNCKDGFFHFRRHLGFIGTTCTETKFSNKMMMNRFKTFSTPEMEEKRSYSSYYQHVQNQIQNRS